MSVAIIGVSVPVIILGPIMIWLFAVEFNLLPPTGWGMKPPYVLGLFPSDYSWKGFWQYTIMPSFALGLGSSAVIARLTRASLLQVIREDYIRTARAKGLKEKMIILRHALKKCIDPSSYYSWPHVCRLINRNICHRDDLWHPRYGSLFCHKHYKPGSIRLFWALFCFTPYSWS